jgi:hypothetical protein
MDCAKDMKNLLIAFLLAVFCFQGAFVAIGEDRAHAAGAQPAVLDVASEPGEEAPDPASSAAIEELSDYLPTVTPLAHAEYPVPARRLPGERFLSIHLPTVKPPPRA